MEFLEYQVIEPEWKTVMYYSYKEKIINMEIVKLSKEGVSYYISDHNAKIVEKYPHLLGTEISIWELNSDSEMKTYMAEMEYKDCRYVLSGILPLEEIKKMLEYMIF